METVEVLDTSGLERTTRRRGGAGAAGYDRRMLLGCWSTRTARVRGRRDRSSECASLTWRFGCCVLRTDPTPRRSPDSGRRHETRSPTCSLRCFYRRLTTGPVFMATTVNDKLMYVVLVAAIVAGLCATALGSGLVGEAYNYRETISVWFRSIWVLQPRADLMAAAPIYYQVHVMIGLALFTLWPHQAGARVQRTGRLPVPALHRLPQPGRRGQGSSGGVDAAAPGLVTTSSLRRDDVCDASNEADSHRRGEWRVRLQGVRDRCFCRADSRLGNAHHIIRPALVSVKRYALAAALDGAPFKPWVQAMHGCDGPVYGPATRPVWCRGPPPWVQPRRRGAEDW